MKLRQNGHNLPVQLLHFCSAGFWWGEILQRVFGISQYKPHGCVHSSHEIMRGDLNAGRSLQCGNGKLNYHIFVIWREPDQPDTLAAVKDRVPAGEARVRKAARSP